MPLLPPRACLGGHDQRADRRGGQYDFDAVLILVFNMGVAGAALATIISQGLSALWVVRFLLGRKTGLRIKKENLRLDWKLYAPCLALGMSPFVMQSTEGVISVCFNASLQKYGGDLAVGAMTILSSVMQFSMLPLQGLTQGAQPIISYNFGAGNADRVRKTFRLLLLCSLAYSVSLWLVAMLLPDLVARIFTPDGTPHRIRRLGDADLYGGLAHFWRANRLPADLYCIGQRKSVPVFGCLAEDHPVDSLDFHSPPVFPAGCRASHGRLSGGTGGRYVGSCHHRMYLCHFIPKNNEKPGGTGMHAESLIFDVDGTLWNSVDLVVKG